MDKLFKEVVLCYSEDGITYKGIDFGLREHFTVPTQHIYGTDDEILFILNTLHSIPEEYSYESVLDVMEELVSKELKRCIAGEERPPYTDTLIGMIIENDTLCEMKRILHLVNIEYEEGLTSEQMYKRYFDHTKHFDAGNYFYWFKCGKRTYYYYTAQKMLAEKYLKDKTSS